MEETTRSPTRTKATWKPRIDEGDPSFFEVQDATMVALGGAEPGGFREPGRAPVAEMPYQGRDGLAGALGSAPVTPTPWKCAGRCPPTGAAPTASPCS